MIDLSPMEIKVDQCIWFRKNDEPYGLFSNMHNKYPLTINNSLVRSSEALFQMCRYPDYSDVQIGILRCPHAYYSKQYARTYLNHARADWFDVNVEIMHWVVKLKAYFYWSIFYPIYHSIKDQVIVERSRVDDFWGAKCKDDILRGVNVLGKIHMSVRDEMIQVYNDLPPNMERCILTIVPPEVPNFLLFGKPVPPIDVPIDLININLEELMLIS